MAKKRLWMKVTNDEYELPIAVAENLSELAKMTGLSVSSLQSMFCRKRKGVKPCKGYVEVYIDDED